MLLTALWLLSAGAAFAAPISQFAVSPPISYCPGYSLYLSPGYDGTGFGNPEQAVGAPTGEGTNPGGNPDHVTTLGAFGGSITLKFDHRVKDDPHNPFGVDAIVYGNAFRTGSLTFMEAGTIEISRDNNGNGVADDQWYLIRGSHMPVAMWTTKEYDKYSLSYPPGPPIEFKAFYPGKTSTYGSIWYPTYPDHVILGAYSLPTSLAGSSSETPWGYADCFPTLLLGDMDANNTIDDTQISPEEFYTTPDDPMSPGFTPGCGGGNAIDIAWARDANNQPANLDGFDFIRITTAVDANVGGSNEASTEIDGVADVSPIPESIRHIKSYPDGTEVRLNQALVTAVFPGEFYVRDCKFFGIKVKSSIDPSPGDLVNVIGVISTVGGERFICSVERGGIIREAFARSVVASEPAVPIGFPNILLGGKALNAYTPGVTGGVGINNLGLLVRTWGKVVSTGQGCFHISDGSIPEGIKISPGALQTQNPRMVIVTGISSCEIDGSVTRRVIRPLTQGGILEIE